jgi:small subunit ribosomal protein S16
MVTIRLARAGAKKRPFYHIVVTENANRRDGRFIERLGYFDPLAQKGAPGALQLSMDRVNYWLSVGAKATDRAAQLIAKQSRTQAA